MTEREKIIVDFWGDYYDCNKNHICMLTGRLNNKVVNDSVDEGTYVLSMCRKVKIDSELYFVPLNLTETLIEYDKNEALKMLPPMDIEPFVFEMKTGTGKVKNVESAELKFNERTRCGSFMYSPITGEIITQEGRRNLAHIDKNIKMFEIVDNPSSSVFDALQQWQKIIERQKNQGKFEVVLFAYNCDESTLNEFVNKWLKENETEQDKFITTFAVNKELKERQIQVFRNVTFEKPNKVEDE